MNVHHVTAFLLAAVMTAASLPCAPVQAAPASVTYSSISPAVNGGEPIRGVDISSVLSVEKAGVTFRDSSGGTADIFEVLADHGVNYIRVRVWNQPDDGKGHSYGGGNTDVRTAAEIGRRAAMHGMKLLVDFHYSDFWADPEKQTPPKAWEHYSDAEKSKAIYDFTLSSLKTIREAGADIGMVQVGNETNCYFCGETDMYKICDLFQSGCKAVHDFDSSVLRVLHFANPSTGYYDWYAEVLHECNVDYDVFATSYYPYWHGTSENMSAVLKKIADTYGKYVMVAETAYPYTNEDGDTFGNVVSKDASDVFFRYEISVEGQAECLTDVFQAVADVGDKGIGVFYWEPAWLGKQGLSWQEKSRLWDSYGSGWATSYAAEYDKSVTASGGSSYDNQALFGFDGSPLASLDVFTRIYPQAYRFDAQDAFYPASGLYTVRNAASSLYLNADTAGNAIQTDDAAVWHLERQEDGYTLSLADTGMYLTVMDGSESRSSVGLAPCSGGKEQLFVPVQRDGGCYLLTKASDERMCVDVFDRSTSAGAWMTYNKALLTQSQQFTLTLTEADPTVVPTEPQTTHPTQPETRPPRPDRGDIYQDGSVNLTDIVLLQKYLLLCASLDREQMQAADMNDDGKVDVFDLGYLKRRILNER